LMNSLTGIPFTVIYNIKNEFTKSMCQCTQAQTARGHPVLIMRQDNGGENKKSEKRLHSANWKLPLKIEYTAANTPLHNARVKVKFTYLASKARAAMHAAEVPRNRRFEFFPEVTMTITKLDWLKLIIVNKVKKTRLNIMAYLYPILPGIYVLGEEQESSKPAKIEKSESGESWVCLWATPKITRVNATECGIQLQRRFLRHVAECFSKECSLEQVQSQYITNKVLTLETLTVSSKTRGGVL
jgi:hypothetical protein